MSEMPLLEGLSSQVSQGCSTGVYKWFIHRENLTELSAYLASKFLIIYILGQVSFIGA